MTSKVPHGRPRTSDGTPASPLPPDAPRVEEMVSVIAHEVRNPLAAIRSALEIVERRVPPGPEQRVLTDVIARVDALDALVDELLLFSETPQPNLQPVSLEPLIAGIARTLEDRLDATCTVKVVAPPPTVSADPAQLRTVFMNLLTNAIHASGASRTACVTLGASDHHAVVTITDRGLGFSDEARDAEFRPFFTTKARGTGLGLPTARRLVRMHGGDVIIDSTASGTEVRVTLPTAT
jgi:signal transduction histidine kinase